LLLAQAVCHVFAAEVVGLVLVVLVLFRHGRRDWPRELGLLALMAFRRRSSASTRPVDGASSAELPLSQAERVWPSLAVRIELLASAFAAGPWWRAWPPIVLAVAGIAFAVQRTRRRATTPTSALSS